MLATKVKKNSTGRVTWIHEAGTRILYMDFRKAPIAESITMMDEYIAVLSREQGPVYLFTDVSDAEYDSSIAAKWKAARLEYGSVIKASAIIGLKGLVGLAVRSFIQLAEYVAPHKIGGPMKIFNTREEALEWVVKQSKL